MRELFSDINTSLLVSSLGALEEMATIIDDPIEKAADVQVANILSTTSEVLLIATMSEVHVEIRAKILSNQALEV